MSTRLSKWIFTTVVAFALAVTLLFGMSFVASAESEGETNVETDPSAQSTETLQPIVAEDIDFSTLGDPVERWDISATSADNVIAEIYNDPENEGKYILIISGNGKMKNWSFSLSSPWYRDSSYELNIIAVLIEEGVANIGDYAFTRGSNLSSAVISDTVTSIGTAAFYGCSSLTGMVIPEGVTSIADKTFYRCSGLESIEIPSSVTSIGSSAFYNCSGLTSLEIPEGVTSIGHDAFNGCSSLTSIEIPEGVTSIGSYVFSGCRNLMIVIINNPDVASTCTSSSSNGYLAQNAITIAIKPSITEVGSYITGSFTNVDVLDIWVNGEMERYTIYSKHSHKHWVHNNDGTKMCPICGISTVGKSVDTIKPIEEWDISATSSDNVIAELYADLENEGYYSLIINGTGNMQDFSDHGTPWYKYRLKIIGTSISMGVTNIGGYAFSDCAALESVIISESVNSIRFYAFSNCANLTSITIPENVTKIGERAFSNCTKLEEIKFNATALDDLPYQNHVFYSAGQNGKGINVTVGKNVTKIPAHLFNPSSTSSCAPKIKSVEFESGSVCESIGDNAFYYCTELKSITIPENVTTMGYYSFYGCVSITEIEFNAVSMQDFNRSPFSNVGSGFIVLIGKNVTKIPQYLFADTEVISISFEDGSVCETIDEYAFSKCEAISRITIPENIKVIGKNAFQNCSSLEIIYFNATAMDDLDLSNNVFSGAGDSSGIDVAVGKYVTKIPNYLFYNNTKVISVEFDVESVCESIGEYAFYRCTFLESILLPKTVKTIGKYAFYLCVSLSDFTIPEGLTEINDYSFYECSALKSINIPNSVSTIGYSAFQSCKSLQRISIGNNVTIIGYSAFRDCWMLTEVIISPNSKLEEFAAQAFYNCTNLRILTIPSGVMNIGNDAFTYCYKLNEFYNYSSLKIVAGASTYGNVGYYAIKVLEEGENSNKRIDENGFVFYEYNCRCYLIDYIGCQTEIILPDNYNGKKYDIYKYAFYQNETIEKIVISNGVTDIGERAFYQCSKLTNLMIGNSVKSVGVEAFEYCTELRKIDFAENSSLETIQDSAFRFCYKIEELITPNSLISIGYYAFANSTEMKKLVISDSVEIIHSYHAFTACQKLETVIIGKKLSSIGTWTFQGCFSLKEFIVHDENPYFKAIDGNLYNKSGTHLIRYAIGKKDSYFSIPPSVTDIESDAFIYARNLEAIYLPENVRYFNGYASNYLNFRDCVNLRLVIIDNSYVARSIKSYDAAGYLVRYATTVATRSDITEVGSYVTNNLKNVITLSIPINGEQVTYVVYSNHSHEPDATTWGEVDKNGIQTCSVCGLEKVSHVCEWGDWEVLTAPGFDHTGMAIKYCIYDETHCIEHQMPMIDTVNYLYFPPDCESTGSYTYINDVGIDFVYEVEAAGHRDYIFFDEIPAKCENDGMRAHYKCGYCDKLFDKTVDNEYKVIEDASVLVITQLGHDYDYENVEYSWGSNYTSCVAIIPCKHLESDESHYKTVNGSISKSTIEPTCEDPGTTTYTATFSDEELLVQSVLDPITVPALGHDWGDWALLATDKPTLEKGGTILRQCQTNHNHWDEENIPPLTDPEYSVEVIYVATCVDMGLEIYTIVRDGESASINYIIQPSGHSINEDEWIEKAATCTDPGEIGHYVCGNCSKNIGKDGKILDSIVIPAGHKYDYENPNVVAPNCTTPGYTYLTCMRAGCDALHQYNFKDPLDHNFKVWTTVAQDTCDTVGQEESICEFCNAKASRPVDEIHHEYKKINDVDYKCVICGDSYYIDDNGKITYENPQLFNCATDFGFYVIYNGAREDLYQLVEIYDSYFIDSEGNIKDEHKDSAKIKFDILPKGNAVDGKYWITPSTPYSNGNTYVARLASGVSFNIYRGQAIKFTIEKADKSNNSWVINEDVVQFINYFDFKNIQAYDDGVCIEIINFAAILQSDIPDIGQIVCITRDKNIKSLNELLTSTNFEAVSNSVIGRVEGFIETNNNTTVIVLSNVNPEDIFKTISISSDIDISLEDIDNRKDEIIKDIADGVKNQLASDDNFKTFLAVIGKEISDWCESNGLTVGEGDELLSILPDITVDGNKLKVTVNITANTHLKDEHGNDYGTISVTVTVNDEATFEACGYARLTLLGLYFDASLTAESTTNMNINVSYKYAKDVQGSCEYVGNPNTKVVHCGDCRYVSMMKNPFSGYTSYNEYIAAGYRPCTVCQPNEYKSGLDRINDELNELLIEGVEYTHWPKTKEQFDKIADHSAFKKALDALSDSVLDANESKGMLLGTVGGVYAGFILRLDAYFVFDFDIEAVVNLEISKTSIVTHGARKTWYGIEYYKEETSESESLDFKIFGELHAKVGIGVDGSITFIDIMGVGVRLEVGTYLDVSGCAHVLIEVDNDGDYSELYGALHIDFGLYYKSYVYLRISKYNMPFIGRAEAHKIPIYVAGPNKVYNMYASDETHITAQEDVTHNSNYIDLSVLKIPVMYIYLGGIDDIKDENILKALADELSLSNFSISIVLEDEKLPDTVRLDGYILRFDDSAGKEFTVKLKITCKLQDDSWSKSNGVNSVYMFEEEHILVINVINNHQYELLEYVKGNCVEKAYAIYRCDCCNGEIKEYHGYDTGNHSDVSTGNSFVVDIDEKIATCTQAGYSSHRKCSKCGETFGCVETEIDPNNHKWSTTLKTHYYFENSCEDGGYTYYSCDYGCGEIYVVQNYDSFEHKMTIRVPATNSTCSKQGHEEYYKCAVCGYHTTPSLRPLDPENHTVDNESWEDKTYREDCKVIVAKYTECIECYYEIILSETITYEHLYIDVPGKEATCDTIGYYAYKECAECGDKDGYKTYGPLGHIKGDIVVYLTDDKDCSAGAITFCWCEKCGAFLEEKSYSTYSHNWCVESGKEPTCDEPGVTDYHYCLRCEQDKGGETIPKLGHDCSWVITRQPTYEQSGSRDYVCNRCEYVSLYNRTIPMLPYTDGLLYSLDYKARTMTIVGVDVTVFNGSEILVPPIFEGCDVTKIGANAFLNAPNLKNLTIPSSITKINSLAFENCVALENFYYKGTLSDYLNIEFSGNEPMGFENLYIGSITGALVEALNFSKEVDVINDFAFAGFTSIKSVIIAKNMTVGAYAFYNCTELNELKLNVSDGAVYVLEGAFKNTAITTLTLDTCVSEISSFAFDGVPIQLLTIKNTDIVSVIKERDDTVESSFEGLMSVLTVPETVLIDSELDFVDLSDIFDYSDLIVSENEAYYVYSKHSHFVDSGFWVVNGNGSSHSCSMCGIDQLHTDSDAWEVTIESTIDHVGKRVIRCLACNKITKTDEIPCLPYTDGLQYQLSDCGSYYTVVGVGISQNVHINVPPTYKSLPVSAINFDGFKTVDSIEFGEKVSEFKGSGGGIDLYISNLSAYCSIKTEEYGVGGSYRDIYLNGEKIVNLVIPNDVEVIHSDLFSCLLSVESIVVSDGVKTISEWTFARCKQLRRIEIAESVIEIGTAAFYECENLTFVIICSPKIASEISHYSDQIIYGHLLAYADTIYIPREIEDVSDYIMNWHGPEGEVVLSGQNYISYSHHGHKWEKMKTLITHTPCIQDEISLLRCEYCFALKETVTTPKHAYITYTVQATCLESGYTTHVCECGVKYITDLREPLGHYAIYYEGQAPTCTEIGWNAYETCKRYGCDYSTYVELPALGHDKVQHPAQTETCTEHGWNAYETCTGCDYTTYEEIPAKGHTYGEWIQTIAPGCETKGEERRDCVDCDHYETKEVDALGHDKEQHSAKAPTCTEIGWNAYETCKRDGCNYTTYVELTAKGHNYSEWIVEVSATCEGEGTLGHYHCSACNKNFDAEKNELTTIVIPALGHTESDWIVDEEVTCTEDGSKHKECTVCEKVLVTETIEKLGHDKVQHLAQAETCTEHGWNAYETCKRDGCDYTTYEEIPAKGHTYGEWTQTVAPGCETKGEERRDCVDCDHYETMEVDALGYLQDFIDTVNNLSENASAEVKYSEIYSALQIYAKLTEEEKEEATESFEILQQAIEAYNNKAEIANNELADATRIAFMPIATSYVFLAALWFLLRKKFVI